MQSNAPTVVQYLSDLPDDRRAAITAVRDVILENLDKDYSEVMSHGMIGYCVPHRVYPSGHHGDPRQPLLFAALASQKNYMSLYLMSIYCGCEGGEESEHARWFRQAWAKTRKKLDTGKACIRFRKVDDLALDVIGEAIRRVPVKVFLEQYEAAIRLMKNRASEGKPGKKSAKMGSGRGGGGKAPGTKAARKAK